MFNKIFGKFSKDFGIDLGTTNTLIYTKDKGIVINEPSVVAINIRTDEILSVGEDAKKMVGKTPAHIRAIKPLSEGVISDFEVTEKMISYFVNKIHDNNFSFAPRPRMVIGIPLEITEVEKKAVEDAAKSAGAREVYLIEESMASAIGAGLPVAEAVANMIVDIGGGTAEIAVISLGGVVTWKCLKTAGDTLDSNIIDYIREEFNLLIGEQVARSVKVRIGSTIELKEKLEIQVRGRDLLSGLPREVVVNDIQIRNAIDKTIENIVENIKITLENTPPELVADIYEHGIFLSGGGALLRGISKRIANATKISVKVVDDPLTAVVRGTGMLLDDQELLNKVLTPGSGEI